MKKVLKICLMVSLLMLSAVILCSCGSDKKTIVGTWRDRDHPEESLAFYEDNTACKLSDRYYDPLEKYDFEISSSFKFKGKSGRKFECEKYKDADGIIVLYKRDSNSVSKVLYYQISDSGSMLHLTYGDCDFEEEKVTCKPYGSAKAFISE